MTGSETLSLAGDFPPATSGDWRKLVDAVLKGAPFARLENRTYDGLTVEPLYERAIKARAVTGRGTGTAWTLLQRVDHPDPAAANAQALDDLENGATGLVLVFAGSVSANGFGLDAPPGRARPRTRRHRSRRRRDDRSQPVAGNAAYCSSTWRRSSKRARSRRRLRRILASASILSARFAAIGRSRAKLE